MGISSKIKEKNAIRLFLVDGFPAYREGFRSVVENVSDIEVIGIVESGEYVYQTGSLHLADVIVVDANLPNGSGFELCLGLAFDYPQLKTILLCEQDWTVYLVLARKLRCASMLVRRTPIVAMLDVIRQARTKSLYTPDQVNTVDVWQHTIGVELKSLQPREWRVLWHLSAGLINRDIAVQLGVSKGTIEKYISNLLHKFSIASRSDLLQYIHHNHLEVLRDLSPTTRLQILDR